MIRDYALSIGLHLVIIVATLASSPFAVKRIDPGEVIRVSLHAAPPTEVIQPQPVAPQVPKAVEAEPEEIPLDDPTSADEAAIDEPQEEPEPEPEEEEKPESYQPRADAGGADQTGLDSGQTEVEAAGGTPFAGATVDDASFDYPYWFTQALYKIQSDWRNPVAADYSIVCVIYFQVLQSGRVVEVNIHESSGIRPFDEACLRAVQQAAPFPPLPKEFTSEIIGITLPFKYEP
ncbi:MAG: energy transducer TonB [Candidatus Zixiibacteriota bacterium]|nr:MAG: energy transducer TonB [candidate division Zixibacteria bacterium]